MSSHSDTGAVTRSLDSKRPSLPPATYSLNEIASLFGMSYTKANELLHTGGLPVEPIKIGRTYRFPKAVVDRMLGLVADGAGSDE